MSHFIYVCFGLLLKTIRENVQVSLNNFWSSCYGQKQLSQKLTKYDRSLKFHILVLNYMTCTMLSDINCKQAMCNLLGSKMCCSFCKFLTKRCYVFQTLCVLRNKMKRSLVGVLVVYHENVMETSQLLSNEFTVLCVTSVDRLHNILYLGTFISL